jgi:hypothetical protein
MKSTLHKSGEESKCELSLILVSHTQASQDSSTSKRALTPCQGPWDLEFCPNTAELDKRKARKIDVSSSESECADSESDVVFWTGNFWLFLKLFPKALFEGS